MANRHLMTFIAENPHFKLVEGSGHERLLYWAHENKYIHLTKFTKHALYTETDLEKAMIWAEKQDYSPE